MRKMISYRKYDWDRGRVSAPLWTTRAALVSILSRAGALRRASRPGHNCEAEAMQLDDRGDHAQAQAYAFGVSSFVRAIEALGNCFPFDLGNAGACVAHPDNGLAFLAEQCEFNASTFGREFQRVVDQIG